MKSLPFALTVAVSLCFAFHSSARAEGSGALSPDEEYPAVSRVESRVAANEKETEMILAHMFGEGVARLAEKRCEALSKGAKAQSVFWQDAQKTFREGRTCIAVDMAGTKIRSASRWATIYESAAKGLRGIEIVGVAVIGWELWEFHERLSESPDISPFQEAAKLKGPFLKLYRERKE